MATKIFAASNVPITLQETRIIIARLHSITAVSASIRYARERRGGTFHVIGGGVHLTATVSKPTDITFKGLMPDTEYRVEFTVPHATDRTKVFTLVQVAFRTLPA